MRCPKSILGRHDWVKSKRKGWMNIRTCRKCGFEQLWEEVLPGEFQWVDHPTPILTQDYTEVRRQTE